MVRVALTDAGRMKIEDLFPRFNEEEAAVTAHLSADQQETLATLLRSMLRAAGGTGSRPNGRSGQSVVG